MSQTADSGFDLELHFLPAWAKEPVEARPFAKFEGRGGDRPDRGDRGDGRRPDRRGGPGRSRGPDDRGGFRGDRRGPRRDDRFQRPEPREPAVPLPDVEVCISPEPKGVDSLVRQIKLTGRAYPLFDIAGLILNRPERYHIRINVIKKADGAIAQPLFVCNLDDTLWLSEAEATAHILGKHFGTFYKAERSPADPPKGTYTFVAVCGLSGVVLGPPNYHSYQPQLHKLHTERFARMPFDDFKAKVKIVRDEAVVKKWIEDQSWKTEFLCLNVPEELKLASREEVDRHFRATHLANIVKPVESHELPGPAAQGLPCHPLRRLVRRAVDDQQRFPMQLVSVLSQMFAAQGLQFFKVNKTVTHVAIARPSYLDLEVTPVSDGVRRIVEFVNAHPKCARRKLFEALAPGPTPATPAGTKPPAGAEMPSPTPEQTVVISDLHWLVHQGHVIEFANGTLETAKKPLPRPPAKSQPAKAPAASPAPVETTIVVTQPSPDTSVPTATPGESVSPPAPDPVPDTPAPSTLT